MMELTKTKITLEITPILARKIDRARQALGEPFASRHLAAILEEWADRAGRSPLELAGRIALGGVSEWIRTALSDLQKARLKEIP